MNTELTAKEIKDRMTGGEWEPSFTTYKKEPKKIYDGVGVNELIENGGQYMEKVFDVILPDSDETYKIHHKNIEADVYATCKAVNSTYGKGLDPEKMEECVNKLQSAFYFLQQLEEHGVVNKTLMEEIDAVLESAQIK